MIKTLNEQDGGHWDIGKRISKLKKKTVKDSERKLCECEFVEGVSLLIICGK